jgi:hypothetical protein
MVKVNPNLCSVIINILIISVVLISATFSACLKGCTKFMCDVLQCIYVL